MSMFSIFGVSGSAVSAQSQRLNVVASNLANADSAVSANGTPYRAKQVVFSAEPLARGMEGMGVRVAKVLDVPSPARMVYDPKHPMADSSGYVTMPNVNVVEEMTNMISASHSYQTNLDMMNTAKNLLIKTLALGQ